jgi:hypothetical protein
VKPRCLGCLSEEVAVRVTDEFGFEHWFCAADWAANEQFHEKMSALFEGALKALTP